MAGNRYRVQAPVREQLLASESAVTKALIEAAQTRMLAFFTNLARQAAREADWRRIRDAKSRLDAEFANLDQCIRIARRNAAVREEAYLLAGMSLLPLGPRSEEISSGIYAYLAAASPGALSPEDEVALCLRLGRTARWSGDADRYQAAVARAARCATRIADRRVRGLIALSEADCAMMQHQFDLADERLDYAKLIFARVGESWHLLNVDVSRGSLFSRTDRSNEAVGLFMDAAPRLASLGDRNGSRRALVHAASALYIAGRAEESLKLYEKLLAARSLSEARLDDAAMLHNYSLLLMSLGRYEDALKYLHEAEETNLLLARTESLGLLSISHAELNLLLGDYSGAETMLGLAEKVATKQRQHGVLKVVLHTRAISCGLQRNWQALASAATQYLNSSYYKPTWQVSFVQALLSAAHAFQGKSEVAKDEANSVLGQAGDVAADTRVVAYTALAKVEFDAGNGENSRMLLEKARQARASGGLSPYAPNLPVALACELLDDLEAEMEQNRRQAGVTGKLLRASDKALRFACECGAEFTVKRSRIGKATTCPKCGIRLFVPAA